MGLSVGYSYCLKIDQEQYDIIKKCISTFILYTLIVSKFKYSLEAGLFKL